MTQTIHTFQDLGNNIYLWEPPAKIAGNSPSLIILCTWLGGSTTNRVDKYTTGYRKLYPNTPILLIRTVFADISARTFKQLRDRLAPARNVIRKLFLTKPAENGGIYLHIFSHGGCNTAIQLATSLREGSVDFPLRKIILDCCPGDATYFRAYGAAALSLPVSQPANALGKVLLHIPIAAITGSQKLGLMASVQTLRRELNDAQLFGAQAARLYLYSRADRMVHFEDVQSHLEDAKALGYEAQGILFEQSAHCALPIEHGDGYWNAIETFWDGGDSGDSIASSIKSRI